jgi:hypothetical protein
MHNGGMQRCQPYKRKLRHRITLALDDNLWGQFQKVMQEHWKGSFTSWVEYAMECYSRNSCDDCPYCPYSNQSDRKVMGIGKPARKGWGNWSDLIKDI